MFSAIFDVALGLIVVFLVLSIITSAINEYISNLFRRRANSLEAFVGNLLLGTSISIDAFYNDTLIASQSKNKISPWQNRLGNILLRRQSAAPGSPTPGASATGVSAAGPVPAWTLTTTAPEKMRPPYIRAEDFSQALLDSIRRSEYYQNALTSNAVVLPQAAVMTGAVSGAQNKMAQVVRMTTDLGPAGWQALIAELPDGSPLKAVMLSMMAKMESQPASRLHQQIEDWYNRSMDTLTGWYKGRTQLYLLVIGIVMAGVLNIDTITITDRLLENPALRSAVDQVASKIAASNETAVPTETFGVSPTPNAAIAPAPSAVSSGLTPTANPTEVPTEAPTAVPNAAPTIDPSIVAYLDQLDIPIGWPDPAQQPATTPSYLWLLRKLIGLLMTGFAVSQGAPFWFDLLNRIINLRSSLKPAEEKPAVPTPTPAPPPSNLLGPGSGVG